MHGRTVRVQWAYDNDHSPPWTGSDGHGDVRESHTPHRRKEGDKRPYERPLNAHADRTSWEYHYDWAGAIKKAKKEGWYSGDINTFMMLTWKHKRVPTNGMTAQYVVERDYQYLRSWVRGEWHWCGIIVEDDETGVEQSLWGIESENVDDFHEEIIAQLADEMWDDVLKALLLGERAD